MSCLIGLSEEEVQVQIQVRLHLKDQRCSFEDNDGHIVDREE